MANEYMGFMFNCKTNGFLRFYCLTMPLLVILLILWMQIMSLI